MAAAAARACSLAFCHDSKRAAVPRQARGWLAQSPAA
ncbi:Uncharacterised protein [Bordetella pertussis]|nr:Uncharacterised protein [Bordetella pertussis]